MKIAMRVSWRFGRFAVVLGALSLGTLVTGCADECVDSYDCANEKGSAPEGKRYVCESNRCELRDSTSPAGDAGTDAGTGTDSGTDAGTNPGPDAGTDAGVSCAELPHDAKLGTLQLQTGFAAAESVALPAGISEVTALKSGTDFKLYGLRGSDKSLYALGTWPDVALGGAALKSVVAGADLDQTTYLSGFLANDGTRLLAGYTKDGPFTNIPGTVLVYDTASPDKSTYVSANGNYSAAGIAGYFFINGQGVQGVSEGGNAIYGLKTDTAPFQGSKVATFPEEGVFSGSMAATSSDIVVLGYGKYDNAVKATTNFLRAVAPATYTPALTSGTPLALSDANAPRVYSGTDFFSAAGFGDGVALHRGVTDKTTYESFTRDVSRISLTTDGIDPKAVTVGELKPVLTTDNNCTRVGIMAPMGVDLLVGVSDKNGSRLVRIRKQ